MTPVSGGSRSLEEASAVVDASRKRRRGARSDQQLNNSKLIGAAGTVFATADGAVSLADIARVADVSVATAFRHFDSADDALSAYRRDFGERLREFSLAREAFGLELMEAVSRRWVDLVLEGAPRMSFTSSLTGRGQKGPGLICTVIRIWTESNCV